MEITKVTVRKFKQKNSDLKAFATVTLEDELVLTGIKLRKGKKGLTISMPSQYSEKAEDYFDIFFPITADFRAELQEAIIDEYENPTEDEDDEKPKKKSKSKSKSKSKKKDEDDDDEDD